MSGAVLTGHCDYRSMYFDGVIINVDNYIRLVRIFTKV